MIADRLTAKELEVARLIAEGGTTKSIAGDLQISPKTVDHHVRAIAQLLPGRAPPMRRIMRWYLTDYAMGDGKNPD